MFVSTVALLLIAVATTAAEMHSSPGHLVPAFRELISLKKAPRASGVTCAVCEDIADAFYRIAQDQSMLNGTVGAALRAECEAAFATKPTERDTCLGVVNGLIMLLGWGAKKLSNWQVNFKGIACSDFVEVCIHPCCAAPFTPEQVRLSFGDSSPVGVNTTMTVSWVTLNATTASTVQWRVAGGAGPWQAAEGTWRTYTSGGWIGVVHGATMVGLQPGMEYEYRVGSQQGWTRELFTFRTLPLNIGKPERPLRFVGIADMDWDNYSDATVAHIQALVERGELDLVVHAGDISYFDGYTPWWDSFGKKIEKIAARVPYMTIQGNHEQIWWNATGYKMRWWMPAAGDGAPKDATYYTVNIGPLRLVMLDSETAWNTPNFGEVQMSWAQKQFASAQQNGQFLFVAHHRPMYANDNDDGQCKILRDQAEAMYRKYGVGLVMTGHVHNYERTLPVYNNTVVSPSSINATAPVYLVNGAAGQREGQSTARSSKPWVAAFSAEIGAVLFSFASSSEGLAALDGTFVRSSDQQAIDTFTVSHARRAN